MTRHTLFRWWYGGVYSFLAIVLLVALVITPGDAIRQALNNKQLYNIFVIAGCYFVTVVLAVLIYFSRLYTNKTVLKAIPKNWIPIEKGEVDKKVRKMIVTSLNRSAAIAWDARPRVNQEPAAVISEPGARDPVVGSANNTPQKKRHRLFNRKQPAEKHEEIVMIPPPRPVWGDISHKGWSSPTSPDLPSLQYTTVILELPNLIEAKAVSLAPTDPQIDPPITDIRAVEAIQRPVSMGLPEYIVQLSTIGMLKDTTTATKFLAKYEYARFSGEPLSEQEFRDLMALFADLLRGMEPLPPNILASLALDEDSDNEYESTSASISVPSIRSVSSHTGTIRTAPSRQINRTSSQRPMDFSTAPATPRSKRVATSRSPSLRFTQNRRPYAVSTSSSESLRSTSGSSVIKLSNSNMEGDLPYTLQMPRAR